MTESVRALFELGFVPNRTIEVMAYAAEEIGLVGSAEIAASSTTNVFAISQREYNHEASTRPSTGNDTLYLITESVSLIRQGFVYIKLTDHAAVAGEALVVAEATGLFVGGTAAAGTVAGESVALNVTADEAGVAGDIIKARIDILV